MLLHRPAKSARATSGKGGVSRKGNAFVHDGRQRCKNRLSCLGLSHFSPLTIFMVAIAGGVVGMAGVLAFYPQAADSAGISFARPQGAVVMGSANALPLPPPPQLSQPASNVQTASTGKGDMAAPLLTHFAALSGPDTGTAPMVMQASITVDEPVSGVAEIQKSPPPEPVDKSFVLKHGHDLVKKLVDLGVKKPLASALVDELNRVWPLKKIRPGQKVTVTLEQQQDFYGIDVTYPVYLTFSPRSGLQVVVETDDEGQFVARVKRSGRASNHLARQSEVPYRHVRGRVSSSLYASLRAKGVPSHVANQMLRALSYRLDLQRQVHKGDSFELLYGRPFSGTSRRYVLHYAAFVHNGRRYAFYRFTPPNGRTTYFDRNGGSVQRGLMHTPVSGARISSPFGMRRHPILGYTKHTGVDFAAPRGTPIHVTGDGVVIFAGWKGGYGRAIMVRHPNGYVTLYAHQSRFAPGIRKGVHVRQGQVIGYVGSTGRSTGPHVHYEVRVNGRPVNPLRVRTAIRQHLRGKVLAQFQKRVARIETLLDELPADTQIARK